MKPIEKIISKTENPSTHILTAVFHKGGGSSGVFVSGDGGIEYEYPDLIENVNEAILNGETVALNLRTFDHSRKVVPPWNADIKIPMKVVRGWKAEDGVISPISEKDMFDAHCVDSETGEIMPPEETVEYAGGWDA